MFTHVRCLFDIILDGHVGEVISQNSPNFSLFKFREKLFYIGYTERIFQKTHLQKTVKMFLFQICRDISGLYFKREDYQFVCLSASCLDHNLAIH